MKDSMFLPITTVPRLLLEPIELFRETLGKPPSWCIAVSGPILCFALQFISMSIFSWKAMGFLGQIMNSGHLSFIATTIYLLMVTISASFYIMIWLVGTGIAVCVDILISDTESHARLLELTGLAFYSQAPFLIAFFIFAVSFNSPHMPNISGLTSAEIQNLVLQYKRSLEASFFYHLMRNLGYAFQAWLIGLFALAYHVFSEESIVTSLSLGFLMYCIFFLGPGLKLFQLVTKY